MADVVLLLILFNANAPELWFWLVVLLVIWPTAMSAGGHRGPKKTTKPLSWFDRHGALPMAPLPFCFLHGAQDLAAAVDVIGHPLQLLKARLPVSVCCRVW